MIVLLMAPFYIFPLILSFRRGLISSSFLFQIYLFSGVFLPYVLYSHDMLAARFVEDLSTERALEAFVLVGIAGALTWAMAGVTGRVAPYSRVQRIFLRDGKASCRLAWAAIAMASIYLGVMLVVSGGLGAFLDAMFRRVKLEDSLANYASIFFWGAYVFAIAAYHVLDRPIFDFRYIRVIFVLFVTLLISVFSFAQGGRSVVVLLVFGLATRHLIGMSRTRQLVVLSILALLALSISVVMLRLRFEVQSGAESLDDGFVSTALTGLTFVDHIALSIGYASTVGYDYGLHYLQLPLVIIPRGLWPSKPDPLSQLLREYLFGDLSGGIPPGLFGEGFIAFGPIGIPIVGIFLGILIGKVDRILVLARITECSYRTALIGILTPLVAFALVRGGTDIGIFRVVIPWLWCLLMRKLMTGARVTRAQSHEQWGLISRDFAPIPKSTS